jgi:hypothetical protein
VATATRDDGKVWTSRAVERRIEPGSSDFCPECNLQVKFQAKIKATQVICNVYVDGRWDRVEHFHTACYDAASQPHGEADGNMTMHTRHRARAS